MKNQTYHAHGKLLLTAEYFVLDGATALAVPVKFGQTLTVESPSDNPYFQWKSLDENGKSWFEASFDPENFTCLASTCQATAERLAQLFCEAKKMNGGRLPTAGRQFQTALTFPRQWGLGTSSTLVHLLAQWAGADAFELQFRTFGGSGYDVACAGADGPILYRLENGQPQVGACTFRPPFAEQLYFVFLGKKQDSREGIARYRKQAGGKELTSKISALTEGFLQAKNLADFENLIRRHEQLVGETVGLPRAKSLYFNDFWGEVKSLGAWGGDFVLATSDRSRGEAQRYFNEKGFDVFFPYSALVL